MLATRTPGRSIAIWFELEEANSLGRADSLTNQRLNNSQHCWQQLSLAAAATGKLEHEVEVDCILKHFEQ